MSWKQWMLAAGMVLLPWTAHADETIDVSPVKLENHASSLPADWYRKGVFAEIYVRGYQDSDGKGRGDLNGLIQRLDYLKQLGVSGLWLMPVFRNADGDHGYSVIDYRSIDRQYGTLQDFDRLLVEAHKRGIGVIIDYVLNHGAAESPLFDEARDDKTSPYRHWYIWSVNHPEGWETFGGDPWREDRSGYYYAVFNDGLPDWNLNNPDVVDYHLNNLKFWLNRGVDGFRFDAVGLLYENGPDAWENQPQNHVLMHRIHQLLGQYDKRYMVCEAPSAPEQFAAASSCGSAFAFGMQKHIIASVKMGHVDRGLPSYLATNPVANMGTILANHDSFAGTRLWQQFRGDEAEYRMAAATLLTLPGIPFIYYGEEIGLGLSKPVTYSDQQIRGPMSWTADPQGAGFSSYHKLFRPLVDNYLTHNVDTENKDPHSLLNFYRALIALRNQQSALSVGSYQPLDVGNDAVFAFLRQDGAQQLLVLLNYSDKPQSLKVPLSGQHQWQALFPNDASVTSSQNDGLLDVTVEAQQVRVYKLAQP